MTQRFNIDTSKFTLEFSDEYNIKYKCEKFTIVVFATERFDGCPKLGIYVTKTLENGDVFRFSKEFDGLDYAMAWVENQLS
jgi:hypothetical protein